MKEYTMMFRFGAMNEGQAELIFNDVQQFFEETLGEYTGAEFTGPSARVLGNRISDKDISDTAWLANEAENVWAEGNPNA